MQHIARKNLATGKTESVGFFPIYGGNGVWHAYCTDDERYWVLTALG